MNKAEAIEKLNSDKYLNPDNSFQEGYNCGVNNSIETVKELDVVNKPVLTKEEAYWLEELKKTKNDSSLITKADLLYYITRAGLETNLGFEFYDDDVDDVITLENYDKTTKMCLALALLNGHTVEKDKFYTAKLKSTGEYLHYDSDENKFHHTFAFDSVAKRTETYHFTKDELVKYYAWENDYYDVNEVKNEIKRTS